MEDQQAQEPQPQSGSNTPPPPPIVTDEPVTSPDEQPGNSHNTGERQAVEQEPVKVIIQEDNRSNADAAIRANEIAGDANSITTRANRIANKANVISFFSLILAGAVFLITYFLFKETLRANETSAESVRVARNALNHQIEQDRQATIDKTNEDIERRREHNEEVLRERFRDSVNLVNQKGQFELQRASTQAQIDAFKTQTEEFEVLNRPYLQLKHDSIRIDTFKIGRPLTATIFIDNLGAYPARILSMLNLLYIKKKEFDYSEVEHFFDPKNDSISNVLNQYIIKQNPLRVNVYGKVPMSETEYKELVSGFQFIYTTGFIKYKNLLNDKVWVYKYSLQLVFQDQHQGTNFIVNENKPEKKYKISN